MKPIPRYKRLYDPNFAHKVKYSVDQHRVNVTKQEIDVETQRVKLVSKYVERKPNDLDVYKVSDFYLDNLKIAGAIDNLNVASLTRDNLSAAAHCEKVANQIINSTNLNNE